MDVRQPTFPLRGGHADHAISGFQPVKPQHSTFISSTPYLSVRPRHEYLSVQRTNRSSIGDFVKSLPPDYRAPPHGLTLRSEERRVGKECVKYVSISVVAVSLKKQRRKKYRIRRSRAIERER